MRKLEIAMSVKSTVPKDFANIKKELKKQLTQIQGMFKEVSTRAQEQAKATKEAFSKFSKSSNREFTALNKKISSINPALTDLGFTVGSSMKKIKQGVSNAGEGAAKTKNKIDELKKSAKTLSPQFKKSAESTKTFKNSIADLTGKFKPLALSIAIAITALTGLSKAYKESFKIGIEFEDSIVRLGAITNSSAEDMKNLTQQALYLGETTAHSATQSSNAFIEMAKLGMTNNEIIQASSGVLNIATAANVKMARAAEVSIATLRQFGLSAGESNRVVDVMAKSFTSTALDMTKFANAMKYAGPVAKSTNISLEETTAAMGTLADAGIAGSMAGTSLRTVFLKMGDATSIVSKRLKKAGVTSGTFTDKLKALKKMNLSITEVQKMFGKTAVTAGNLIIEQADKVEVLKEALDEAKGSAETMARRMLDSTKGSITLMKSRLEGLALQFYATFGDEANNLVKFFTDKLEGLSNIILRNKDSFVFAAVVMKEAIQGIANFILNFANTVEIAFKTVAAVIMDAFGGVVNLAMDAYNAAITVYNKIRTVFGKKPIEAKLSFPIDPDLIHGAAQELYAEVAEVSKELEHRLLYGTEIKKSGAKAVQVEGDESKYAQATREAMENQAKLDLMMKEKAAKRKQESEEASKENIALERSTQKELAEIRAMAESRRIEAIDSEREKELEKIRSFFVTKREEWAGNTEVIIALTIEEKEQLRAINDEYDEAERIKTQEQQAILMDMQDNNNNDELRKLKEKYRNKIKAAKGNADAIKAIEAQKILAISKLQEKAAKDARKKDLEQTQTELGILAGFFGNMAKLSAVWADKNAEARRLSKMLLIAEAYANVHAGVTKAYAQGGVLGIAMGAGVLAAGLAQIAQIKAQKFAYGGIVPGNSTVGDRVPAMVNSREMIITQAQQSQLWNMANGNSPTGRTNTSNNTYEFNLGDNNIYINDNDIDENKIAMAVQNATEDRLIEFTRMLRESEENYVRA